MLRFSMLLGRVGTAHLPPPSTTLWLAPSQGRRFRGGVKLLAKKGGLEDIFSVESFREEEEGEEYVSKTELKRRCV